MKKEPDRTVELISEGLSAIAVSSAYETEPLYLEEQRWFVNCALVARTGMPPDSLMRYLQGVERKMGRVRELRYGPRVIDIDLLLYGQSIVSEPTLVIPHPRMAERAFVLVPLAEVAPDLVDPVSGKTVSQLFAALRTTKAVKRLGPLEAPGA